MDNFNLYGYNIRLFFRGQVDNSCDSYDFIHVLHRLWIQPNAHPFLYQHINRSAVVASHPVAAPHRALPWCFHYQVPAAERTNDEYIGPLIIIWPGVDILDDLGKIRFIYKAISLIQRSEGGLNDRCGWADDRLYVSAMQQFWKNKKTWNE